jgi:hypothetical protein
LAHCLDDRPQSQLEAIPLLPPGRGKRSGTRIELFWRYEQFYYDGPDGWVDADMTDDDPPCGLIRVSIEKGT